MILGVEQVWEQQDTAKAVLALNPVERAPLGQWPEWVADLADSHERLRGDRDTFAESLAEIARLTLAQPEGFVTKIHAIASTGRPS